MDLVIKNCRFVDKPGEFYIKVDEGKIVDISTLKSKTEVNAHKNCECEYVSMRTKQVGTATDLGMEGADSYLYCFGRLPDYYVDKQDAYDAGWQIKSKKLSSVLPGKMIGVDVFANNSLKLPSAPGRIWYEADITIVAASATVIESYIQTTG